MVKETIPELVAGFESVQHRRFRRPHLRNAAFCLTITGVNKAILDFMPESESAGAAMVLFAALSGAALAAKAVDMSRYVWTEVNNAQGWLSYDRTVANRARQLVRPRNGPRKYVGQPAASR